MSITQIVTIYQAGEFPPELRTVPEDTPVLKVCAPKQQMELTRGFFILKTADEKQSWCLNINELQLAVSRLTIR